MKKLLPLFLLFFLSMGSFAQELPDFSYIPLKEKADYAKAEGAVMQAVEYILATPPVASDGTRQNALQFLLKWMEGTPDFSFELDHTIVNISKDTPTLFGVYLACATKYCLENRDMAKDKKAVKVGTLKSLVAYTTNPANNVKPKGELKKLHKASEKGELEKYAG